MGERLLQVQRLDRRFPRIVEGQGVCLRGEGDAVPLRLPPPGSLLWAAAGSCGRGRDALPLPLGEELGPARGRRGEDLRTLLFALGMRCIALLLVVGFLCQGLSLGDGEEKEAFVACLNWIVERHAYGDHHHRLGGSTATHMIREKVFLWGKEGIFLKRYEKW